MGLLAHHNENELCISLVIVRLVALGKQVGSYDSWLALLIYIRQSKVLTLCGIMAVALLVCLLAKLKLHLLRRELEAFI